EGLPGSFKPSMLVDLEHGRRIEVEALNGTLSRLGREVRIPTPVNDFIYACLKPYANGMNGH
ncbi:MAG TPA: ketopantoate reductase C-terminal domain-containing protein, partial [Caldilineaceae bacterium]|nr:ketopantoate reductase C-terminal domain-containing protein [Caldilineaceae bacterium]